MRAGIVTFPGTNREADMVIALERATGCRPTMLWHKDVTLPPLDLVILPGGFSYGDYLRCGAMAAHSPIMGAVRAFAEAGGYVLGVCNGFQILTEAGLLPGALLRNAGLRFLSQNCRLRVERTDLVFTRGYAPGQIIRAPLAHGDGNYVADDETLAELEGEGRVVFRYVDDVNGSRNFIAGIAGFEGRVLGLMPHLEDMVDDLTGGLDGMPMFAGLGGRPQLGPGAAPLVLILGESLAREFGLSVSEWAEILSIQGREPTLTELGIFSVMWSEHCSYKSSRVWLRKLPTTAPWVIHGPGENAGVVDIGDGLAAIFKMESHNHPSFIEPYQGAATGVGGIMRDVFTMGARPIANLNALRFGDPANPATRRIVDGVVRGIGGYGNCVGVPTVGGEVNFHPAYDGNPLVNAMTVGIAPRDRIFLSAAAGIGNPVVYVGARTGRDGIHGATMASAEFGADAESRRPTVQVGDPFTEKLLIEACLELMRTDAIVAIQDMGAAGLTSSSVEMAGRGGVGIELDLDAVPQREPGMTAYEMMLSESQERMLMVLRPDRAELARSIFEKWDLDFAIVGRLTDTGRIVVRHRGAVEADIALDPLAEKAPLYHRLVADAPPPQKLGPVEDPVGLRDALLHLVGSPDLASRAWITQQYDSTIGGQTIKRPGQADAAIVRLPGTGRALALTTDCTPRYCAADARAGGALAVIEAWRNITATGATPLALTDNLNFGNPENPVVMGQFARAIEGMADACAALDFPVVSGNVSLYNETRGADGVARAILPTPAIGGLGVIEDASAATGIALPAGHTLILAGVPSGELGQSLWLREILGLESGAPPTPDPAAERRVGEFVRALITGRRVAACHDVSDGGLLVAIAEMAMAGDCGARLDAPETGLAPHQYWFGEEGARYVLAVADPDSVLDAAADASIAAVAIGRTGGSDLTLPDGATISVASLRARHAAFFPAMMGS